MINSKPFLWISLFFTGNARTEALAFERTLTSAEAMAIKGGNEGDEKKLEKEPTLPPEEDPILMPL